MLNFKHPERQIGRTVVYLRDFSHRPVKAVLKGVNVTTEYGSGLQRPRVTYVYSVHLPSEYGDTMEPEHHLFRNFRDCYEYMADFLCSESGAAMWRKLYGGCIIYEFTNEPAADCLRVMTKAIGRIADSSRASGLETSGLCLAIKNVAGNLVKLADGLRIGDGWADESEYPSVGFIKQMRKRYPHVKLPCDDNKENYK